MRGSSFTAEPRPLERKTELKRTAPAPRSRGVSPASPAQRAKIRCDVCIVTGMSSDEAAVDPAHLLPRSLGGCDDPLCTVPLRRDLHELFDGHELDLVPYLVRAGRWEEMAHMISAHHVDPVALVERLTGGTVEVIGAKSWRPVPSEP